VEKEKEGSVAGTMVAVNNFIYQNIYSLNLMKNKTNYKNSLKKQDQISNKKFDISISNILKKQNYRCAICTMPEYDFICDECGVLEHGVKLYVDYDYQAKQIRMLVCKYCINL
jgi:hypothetical protein